MRTLMLFALASVGIAMMSDTASAFGRKHRRGHDCGCEGTYATTAYAAPYGRGMAYGASPCACGTTGMAYGSGYGNAYGAVYGMPGTVSGGYYPNGMYPVQENRSGYLDPRIPANGSLVPGGTVAPGTTVPNTGRQVPSPMPDK